jgi:Rod binding domain-containing protein
MAAISAVSLHTQFPVVPQPRLVKAAHEFEAQLMKELLSPMTHAASMEDDSDSGCAGAMADFASEALGQALSARGGLGIATSIIRKLSLNETDSRSASDPGRDKPDSTRSAGLGLK